jgi:predicted metalloprotease
VVKFNRKAKIDTDSIRDRRGGGGGGFGGFGRSRSGGGYGGGGYGRSGGSGFPLPIPGLGGKTSCLGSIVSLVVIIIILVVIWQVGGIDLTGGGGGGSSSSDEDNSQIEEDCQTGADADRADCRAAIFADIANDYWSGALDSYEPTETVLFTDGTDTACGFATSEVGPFYCPLDQLVYIDLGFWDALEDQLGAQGGAFAEGYVVAHEYGHHVQNLLGTSDDVGNETGPKSGSVRLELQADCFAGVWASHAEKSEIIVDITNNDIKLALDAAAAVGDDRIQETTTGRVDPEGWTHGSSSQRQQWFTRGYRKGNREACNTFAPDAL